jgi:2-succinyl-6-hydroxy-2,4-cyclohexadiene-1-carboxylate synthase
MGFVDVGGFTLWCEDTGGSGEPVLLVHAGRGNSASWSKQLPALSLAGYRAIAHDLRGFGRSRGAGESDGHASEDVVALLRALGIERAHIVATAYGAFPALDFAINYPALVRKLVVANTFGGLQDPEMVALRGEMKGSIASQELGATYRQTNAEGTAAFQAIEEANHPPARPRQPHGQPLSLARLETISVPTLVIAGDEDTLSSPGYLRRLAEHIPGSKFVLIEQAGHSGFWEQPEAWNRAVLDFLRGT